MRSIFFRRMLVMLSIATILAFALVSAGYVFFSRDTYDRIKLHELLPKAEAIGQLVLENDAGEVSEAAFERMIEKLANAAGATTCIIGADGSVLRLIDVDLRLDEQAFEERLDDKVEAVLKGITLQETDVRIAGSTEVLVVGMPISGPDREIRGCVFMLKSSREIVSAVGQLNSVLLMSFAFVLPLLLLLSTVGMRRVTDPLHQMSEVALSMANGNFDVRADGSEPGEVGLLARALNVLCDNLSQTIYQLRSEKSQLNQILSSLTDGVAALDGLGVLTHYNPVLMKMFGAVTVHSREDLIQDPKIWEAFDEVYRGSKAKTMTYHMPGDRTLWITISPVMTEAGECSGVVGLFKDMTELERLEAMRREYIANVSHELRTPLTAVRGLLEPLADGMIADDETRDRYYHIMLHEVMRLSRLITDMMTLSRLQSGTEYMELLRVNLEELVEDVLRGYQTAAARKGISLEADVSTLSDALTDPDRIEQVLVILLDNAMRYTPEGGKIRIIVREGERLAVSVCDTGCGIPQKDLPYVFERFYKVDKSRKEGGTGLGLSIAQHIVEKLGESISVQSEEGKGTCFTFTLKKFVKNVIALGPAREQWEASLPEEQKESAAPDKKSPKKVQDAPYEVIPEHRKPKKDKDKS
ncbi:MAG: ATP-binding protein [Bacillota bacterium]